MLLEVWREVSRHSEIEGTMRSVAPLVARELGVRALVVRRLDAQRRRLETVAVGGDSHGPPLSRSRTDLSVRQVERLLAWCRTDEVVRGRVGGRDARLDMVVPAEVSGEVVAGPLAGGEEGTGVLVMTGRPAALAAVEDEVVRQLLDALGVALANDSRLHELQRLRQGLEADKQALLHRLGRSDIADAVIGAEVGLRTVMARVDQVAGADVPVLLLGDTGTGKEVVAREIHRRSPRAQGPVVRVNCGAIAPGLVDSELFGHERGSFTGAVEARAGWFERADGGTLFLDEVGELPQEAQVRLLRVLQDGTFERVGGTRPRTVDVRVVAATHRDLHAMVRGGQFREDLWYRLSVFPIAIPPLRERLEDLPALVAHFAARAGQRLGGGPIVPTPSDIDLLLAHDWPGNVRELGSVIERAAILGGGRALDVAAALGTAHRAAAPPPVSPSPAVAGAGIAPLDTAMARHIERALIATHGRIEGPFGAASLLGINPHTLRARMRKLGLDWRRFRERG
jgi:transcriptional regulator with GAF, ATPase, and Fis domain